jgi:hypothetical protein
VFDDPVTVALKDFVAPTRTLAVDGETTTVTLDVEGGVTGLETDEIFVVPVQLLKAAAASKTEKSGE